MQMDLFTAPAASPELASLPPAAQLLQHWLDSRQLRALDVALARFCLQLDSDQHEVALLAALLSRQLQDGHVCLRLDSLAQELQQAASADDSASPARWWASRPLAQWLELLQNSPLVSSGADSPPAPLVLQHQRLYLYRMWRHETAVAQAVVEAGLLIDVEQAESQGERLDGSELEEPMTLTQVVTRFTLRDMMERGESEEELDQVQLMTLHASKGLEFPYVFMVGMEEGFLPHQSSIDEDNIDEERRLAYVGITRAQKELIFTLCKERRQYGELVRPEPSRFLLELPQDDVIWEQERKVVSAEERMQKGQASIANIRAMMAKAKAK